MSRISQLFSLAAVLIGFATFTGCESTGGGGGGGRR